MATLNQDCLVEKMCGRPQTRSTPMLACHTGQISYYILFYQYIDNTDQKTIRWSDFKVNPTFCFSHAPVCVTSATSTRTCFTTNLRPFVNLLSSLRFPKIRGIYPLIHSSSRSRAILRLDVYKSTLPNLKLCLIGR